MAGRPGWSGMGVRGRWPDLAPVGCRRVKRAIHSRPGLRRMTVRLYTHEPEEEMRTVILAESIPLFRLGMRSLLEQVGELNVLEATHPTEILELAQVHQPECAILDAGSNAYDALQICWLLRQQVPAIGILILTDQLAEEQLFRFLIHGANAYEPRIITCESFLDRVKHLCAGEYLMRSERLVSRHRTRPAAAFSPRERPSIWISPNHLRSPGGRYKSSNTLRGAIAISRSAMP